MLQSAWRRPGKPDEVRFEPELCQALLRGYFSVAKGFLTEYDREFIYDSIRLLAYELGMRFFCDYLEGNVYFKARDLSRTCEERWYSSALSKVSSRRLRLCARLSGRQNERRKVWSNYLDLIDSRGSRPDFAVLRCSNSTQCSWGPH